MLELIAADAMEGALPQPYIFDGVYISPKMRCLATAQAACGEMERLLLLQEQGGNAVVSPENLAVVPGLSECAAHVRRHGVRNCEWLSEQEAREILPPRCRLPATLFRSDVGAQAASDTDSIGEDAAGAVKVLGDGPSGLEGLSRGLFSDFLMPHDDAQKGEAEEEPPPEPNAAAEALDELDVLEAPYTYMECVRYLIQHHQHQHQLQERQEEEKDEPTGEALPNHPPRVQRILLVTHREGIRDITANPSRLPYCALAKFRVSATTADGEHQEGAAASASASASAAASAGVVAAVAAAALSATATTAHPRRIEFIERPCATKATTTTNAPPPFHWALRLEKLVEPTEGKSVPIRGGIRECRLPSEGAIAEMSADY